MQKNKQNIVAVGLVILGIIITILGFTAGPKIMLPPIITGLGFFLIAWGIKS
ncbi:MAG: hypothetical protein Q4G27_08620 [Flavobacteriaceae bacterium]|nr:hypothetical protein [Flavobacteriaceae bacterium]